MPGGKMHTAETRRECRKLAAGGLSYREISRRVGISYNSARNFARGYEPKNRQHPCPECGEELRRRAETDLASERDGWLCPGCGRYFSRWQILSPGQKACSQARSLESLRRLRERVRAVVLAAKAEPCVDCGRCFPPTVMHFDHVRGRKQFAISRWPGCSVETVEAEIAKCDLRCANCHILRHHNADSRVREPAVFSPT